MIVVAIITISTVLSFIKGLTRELISLAVWIGSFTVTFIFYDTAHRFFTDLLGSPQIAAPAATSSLFFISMIILGIAGFIIGRFIKAILPGQIDRFAGLILGCARGVLIPCLFYLMVLWVTDIGGKLPPSLVVQSHSYPIIVKITETVRPFIPVAFVGLP